MHSDFQIVNLSKKVNYIFLDYSYNPITSPQNKKWKEERFHCQKYSHRNNPLVKWKFEYQDGYPSEKTNQVRKGQKQNTASCDKDRTVSMGIRKM